MPLPAAGSGRGIWWLLRTAGGEAGDQQPARPTGEPRLGRLQLRYGGEPPARLNPRHAPQRWFQRFDNLLANVVTRAGPDNRQEKGQPMASQVTTPGAGGSEPATSKEQEEL
jgi:hypothetical protein